MTSPAEHNRRLAEVMGALIPRDETTSRVKALFYGPSGAGKTVLAAAVARAVLPEDKKLIYVDTSEGYEVLKMNHPGLFEKVKYVLPFQSLEHLQTISLAIKGGHPDFADIGGIILDEHTKMARLDLLSVQDKRDPNAAVPEWPDYNQALQRMVRTLATLFSVPDLHVFLVGHEKDKKGKDGNIIRTYPSYNPEVAKDVKESLHLVAFCTAKIERSMRDPSQMVYKRMAQVQPSHTVDAKSRINTFSSWEITHEELVTKTAEWILAGGQLSDDLPAVEEIKENKETQEEALNKLEELEIEKIEPPAWTA